MTAQQDKQRTTTLQQLELAYKRLLNPENWLQGDYRRGNKLCLLAACDYLTRPDEKLRQRLLSAIRVIDPNWLCTVALWNDRATRHTDVLTVLQLAIDAERNDVPPVTG